MASTRAQQAEILRNPSYLDQLAGSLLAAAVNVINEATTTTDHANRLAFARAIIGNPQAQAAFMAPGTMSNATLAGEAGNAAGASGTPFTDSDVDFVVASLFNIYADQFAAQQNIGAALQLGA
jgi:hypothetical protein